MTNPTIDPVAASLAHCSRAVEAETPEDAEMHLGMASFYARIADIVIRHHQGDHSLCAHRRLGLS
jgi:hypothetical protein